MKLSNKVIVISAILCAFCVGGVSLLFIKTSKTGQKNNFDQNNNHYDSVQTENNLSESIKDKVNSETYILKLEGSTISAYVELSDGSRTLWNSTSVPPALSQEDKTALKKGISTESFEELCLYFESYLS